MRAGAGVVAKPDPVVLDDAGVLLRDLFLFLRFALRCCCGGDRYNEGGVLRRREGGEGWRGAKVRDNIETGETRHNVQFNTVQISPYDFRPWFQLPLKDTHKQVTCTGKAGVVRNKTNYFKGRKRPRREKKVVVRTKMLSRQTGLLGLVKDSVGFIVLVLVWGEVSQGVKPRSPINSILCPSLTTLKTLSLSSKP